MDFGFKVGPGKPVIDPWELRKDKVLHEKIILVFHPSLLTKVKTMLEDVRIVKLSGWLFKSFVGIYRGSKIVVALPFPGSPAAVAALEVLTAMGGRVFIVVGRVGAIHPELDIGDVVIPTWGLREEGASFHYIPDRGYIPTPDMELAETLYRQATALAKKRRISIVKGGVWTTDAIFRETLDKVIEYSQKGVYGVDMESTALMTVARYRSVKLAIISSVSDKLQHDGRWVKGFQSRRLRTTEKLVVQAALNTIIGFESFNSTSWVTKQVVD